MTATRLDDLFDPERLRRNWIPQPLAEEPVDEGPKEPPKPATIELLDRIAGALRRDVPGQEQALDPVVDRLRKLLLDREPKEDGTPPDPKAVAKAGPDIEQALDQLEDLTDALMIARGT
ncbi:MAG TPA: hypothetical protein VHF22_10980 [Planctomycetota bacterium]|nr:hypothetical protein [Planctomycetota bacterium]